MFVELSPYLNDCDLQIIIKKKEGMLTVSVMPRNPQAEVKIQPIMITGTPQDLDATFIKQLESPIFTFKRETNNIAEFEKQAKETAAAKTVKKGTTTTTPVVTKPVAPPVADLFSMSPPAKETPKPASVSSLPDNNEEEDNDAGLEPEDEDVEYAPALQED